MPDTDISILDRCTGRQLKELLALASTAAYTKVTRNRLLEIGDTEQLEDLLTGVRSQAGQAGDAFLRAVCSADTPVDTLIAIKNTAKHLTVEGEGPAQRAAATLLYHLSVASALGFHARNISSKDPSERLALYKDLAAELSDDELAAIFEKAVAAILSAA
jgi:hypothetical protein